MNAGHWDIVGHDWAVRTLRRALTADTLSHAYLFTGPPGVGRTTLARRMASAILCDQEDSTARPCGDCRACRRIRSGTHPDLHMVESERPGASLKIDQVRQLEHTLSLTPVEGRRQVAVLRRFEEATASAANALLKTLEEPPSSALLVVVAREADLLLPTIVSRCQHVPLRPLPVATVKQALEEKWGATEEQAELLAHLSGGRPGWAVRTLEDTQGLARRARRLDDLAGLIDGSIVERFRYVERLAQDPIATQETLDAWVGWWRDVLLIACNADAVLTNVDRHAEVRGCARRFGVAASADMVRALCDAIEKLRQNANPRLTLEVLMLDLPRT